MRVTLTGYFDYASLSTFEDRQKKALEFGIDAIALKNYQNQPLIELSDGDIKRLITDLKTMKMHISLIDTGSTPYDLYDDRKHANALDEFKYMIKLADRLKVNMLTLRLPEFNDVMEEFEEIKKRIEPYIDAAMRGSKKIVLLMDHYKANIYAYLLKKLKSKVLSIAFDPVSIMKNGESTTTAYRVLRSHISVFFAHDANHQGDPELMGYGKTDILKIMKKLIRDRYDGLIMTDHHYHSSLFSTEVEKKGFFKKIFNSEKKKKDTQLSLLSRRIFPDEETKNVTEDDILRNQIKLLQMIFK